MDAKKPTVWVTQETPNDFLPAQQYGEVKFITRDEVHNVTPSPHNEHMVRMIRRIARKFDHEEDRIIVTGSPYVAAILFMALGERNVPYVNLLRWSNQNRVYIPLMIDMRAREAHDV